MKFLIDPMLSEDLVDMLQEAYPGTVHVSKELGEQAKDSRIWQFAKENGLTILTKDKDFLKLSEENGQPPKLIKLDTGNGPTQEVLDAIKENQQEIEAFERDERSLMRIGQLPERARDNRARK